MVKQNKESKHVSSVLKVRVEFGHLMIKGKETSQTNEKWEQRVRGEEFVVYKKWLKF